MPGREVRSIGARDDTARLIGVVASRMRHDRVMRSLVNGQHTSDSIGRPVRQTSMTTCWALSAERGDKRFLHEAQPIVDLAHCLCCLVFRSGHQEEVIIILNSEPDGECDAEVGQ